MNSEKTVSAVDSIVPRKEQRYACVGIPLLYSAVKNSYTSDLGQKLFKAAAVDMSLSGIAFDVEVPMGVDEKLLVLIEKHEDNVNEELIINICWCRKLLSGIYRVGGKIDTIVSKSEFKADKLIPDYIGKNNIPTELDSLCPACKQQTTFQFVAYQPVLVGMGIMPLYDCLMCGTTRSLSGIL